MNKSKLVQTIENLFDKKEYEKILNILDQNKICFSNEIHSDLDIRLYLVTSYTYYYKMMYKESLEYSIKAFNYMLSCHDFRKETDVLEGIAIITIDSLHKIGKRIKAFFFSRRLVKSMKWTNSEIQQYYLNYKEISSEWLVNCLNYTIIGVVVCIVLIQRLFSFLNRPIYLVLIVLGILSLMIVFFGRKFFIRLIDSIL